MANVACSSRAFYGLAMIAFGVVHFAYLAPTAALVPASMPPLARCNVRRVGRSGTTRFR
jgi:hypothetical protein